MVKNKTQKKVSKSFVRFPSTFDDFKNAALLVSITINVAVFVFWLAIKVTTKYDAEVANFLFSR